MHEHKVLDADNHFIIDALTRSIISSTNKLSLTQYDHNSERYTFELPRIIEGHDMSMCNYIQIHYENISKNKKVINKDFYTVTDLQISPDSDDRVIFSWLISESATQLAGRLKFSIRLECLSDSGATEYSWGTTDFDKISILECVNNTDSVVIEHSDFVERMEAIANAMASYPAVTAEDAGKALVVSADGKIIADDGMVEQDVLPEQVLTFAVQEPDNPENPYVAIPEETPFKFRVGETYYVVWDGVVYQCLAKQFVEDKIKYVYIGNAELSSIGDATDEPFCIEDVYANDTLQASGVLANSPDLTLPEVSHTVRIYQMVKDTSSQSDWNINDETNPAYIKNRPFYSEDPVLTELLPETTLQFETSEGDRMMPIEQAPALLIEKLSQNDQTYIVTWDGTAYEITASPFMGILPYIGNLSIAEAELDNTGEPFLIAYEDIIAVFTNDPGAEHTVSITHVDQTIHKLDEKFLPDLDLGVGKAGEGQYSEVFNYNCTAPGMICHAEGNQTCASGINSHAEGSLTKSSGEATHAEGWKTVASGDEAHAEGAETVASGFFSHAEGRSTQTYGNASHAEGMGTIAQTDAQHAQGRYNVIHDYDDNYAHIVGNGNSDTDRSDAHTLDWDGNAWYAGYVEGKKFILPSTTAGSTKRFAITVDDTGTLSVTEVTE